MSQNDLDLKVDELKHLGFYKLNHLEFEKLNDSEFSKINYLEIIKTFIKRCLKIKMEERPTIEELLDDPAIKVLWGTTIPKEE